MVSMGGNRGEIGWNGGTSQFLKMTILESSAVGDTKIYLSCKAPSDSLEKTAIADLIYNPLYVVN